MAEYYASIPTYIPPVTPGFDYPAYVPATTQLTRSRSNRIVYADDPWNSAGNPELSTPLRRQSRDRAQQPRRLTKTKRPTQPSITSIFPPEDISRQEQMNLTRPDIPLSLRPGGTPPSYPSTAPPYQSTFYSSNKPERKLSFQSVSSSQSHASTPSIQTIESGIDLPKSRPKYLQPSSVPNSQPRISPPPSPAPAGAGTPSSLIPGSRFSSNLGSIDVWADIRSTLDHPATQPLGKRRPLIKLGQAQNAPIIQPPPPQRQAAVAQPIELPGASRVRVSPPKAERRARPTSTPTDGSLSRQKTKYHGDWVVLSSPRPSSAPSLPNGERRSLDRAPPPSIPQLQLGTPFPVLINKRISYIQREEGVANRPLQLQAPAPEPTPTRAPPVRKPSMEKPLDLPLETPVAPLVVTRQPPSRKESINTVLSQPSTRSNTIYFAESAQLTPSPSLTAAIQSVAEEMSVNLSEPSESGSQVHWDVVDTVLKRHGAGRRTSLPQVMNRRSLRLTSDSLDSVEDCVGCEECAGICGHVEQVDDFETESPLEDNDSLEEEEHSADESDIDDMLAAWEEEDRSASPTDVVSEAVRRLREEKHEQEQLWDVVTGLLASRGRQGSCDTTTTISSLETDLRSPTSTYSH
ncbi:hypothetical protein FRC04_003680 [Tulasnella sp. 424]|nr:hypothetical protein FRC04_003680 [Tulasnella sp. 424]KAG8977013.1 hypothetical protein FRC05_002532 [Tulasnella sp. 425]